MPGFKGYDYGRVRGRMRRALAGPQLAAILPAICLTGFWVAGEVALVMGALMLPLLYVLAGADEARQDRPATSRDAVTGLPLRDTLERVLDHALQGREPLQGKTACIILRLDEFGAFRDRYGPAAADDAQHRIADRLRGALRDGDMVCKMGEASYGIAIGPVTLLDLEAAIQLAARLQRAVEDPLSLDATTVYLSCSIGFCLGSRAPLPTGASLIAAAQAALSEAARFAPSAIRSFSTEMQRHRQGGAISGGELARALDNNQILPFFQPQVSTDTGLVTGFEALARWCHPERGMIPPADFLPLVQQAGLMERLGDKMLVQSLIALRRWDEAGINVPQIGVNFATDELMNPQLVEKLRWQLDRYGLEPSRLTVEVLETVVASSPDDVISRNINGLARMGCRIDLDDFGTGHASISSIRRFSVERLKIDRSFVMKVDRDIEQQRMVAAILTMAERLGLSTLAEGVETPGEHAMLAQLGCDHVQGFEIARPMPFEQTLEWIRAYHDGLIEAPKFGRRSG
ncbi:MAG: bifunctional diguanylate cyclase/phosphodiesterase [Rhodobacteraceae bacterium]|nr:bifunctional diguanylate cyclase/phosphodiesterase [Paracoccaceae bacterium]